MKHRLRRSRTIIALIGASLVASSCGQDSSILSGIASDDENTSRIRSYDNVFEAMPDPGQPVRLPGRHDRGPIDQRSHLVVVGRVVDVLPGASMSWDEEGTTRSIHEFGADEAELSTVHLQVDVTKVVASNAGLDARTGERIQVGLSVDADVDLGAAREELMGLGTVVLFLKRSHVFVYKGEVDLGLKASGGVWAILESGGFLGTVSENGRIQFPAMEEVPGEPLLPDEGITVDQLIEAAVH